MRPIICLFRGYFGDLHRASKVRFAIGDGSIFFTSHWAQVISLKERNNRNHEPTIMVNFVNHNERVAPLRSGLESNLMCVFNQRVWGAARNSSGSSCVFASTKTRLESEH